jgi:hypothetical protein
MADKPQRDAIGMAFQLLHLAILVYILTGWALPGVGFYVIAVPVMVLHWPLNRNTCIINNLESLIRTGRWRDPANLEEGAWLRLLIKARTGLELSARQIDGLSYAVLALVWGLGIWHWLGWPTP